MPYAAKDKVAQDEFEGAIEITDDQYAEATDGLSRGLSVTIEDGFKVAPADIPEPESEPEPTLEEIKTLALGRRDYLLSIAAIRIAPLQDAVDLEEGTLSDAASLKKWKQYRVAVNRVPDQSGFPKNIEWPTEPS